MKQYDIGVFYEKYPEAKKVDHHKDTIQVVEEFIEWANTNRDCDLDRRDIYKWLGIDYIKYGKEVDEMLKDLQDEE